MFGGHCLKSNRRHFRVSLYHFFSNVSRNHASLVFFLHKILLFPASKESTSKDSTAFTPPRNVAVPSQAAVVAFHEVRRLLLLRIRILITREEEKIPLFLRSLLTRIMQFPMLSSIMRRLTPLSLFFLRDSLIIMVVAILV